MPDTMGRLNPHPLTDDELDERARREALGVILGALSDLDATERVRVLILAAAFYGVEIEESKASEGA